MHCLEDFIKVMLIWFCSLFLLSRWQNLYLTNLLKLDSEFLIATGLKILGLKNEPSQLHPTPLCYDCVESYSCGAGKDAVITEQMYLMKSLLASQLVSRVVHWKNMKQSLGSLCPIPSSCCHSSCNPSPEIFLRAVHGLSLAATAAWWYISCLLI